MPEKQQKIRITIPSDIDALGRKVLAQMIIDFIQDRTSRGLDMNGDNFAPYSETYKDSKDFSVAGKSNTVNLRLTGDTMASIELLTDITGSVTLGFAPGTSENDKAAWVSDSDGGPARRFLGISANDLNIVLGNFRAVNPEELNASNQAARSIFNRLLGNG